jgi:3-oxoacyl-[acyl-carrier protein] reductase
MNLQEAKVLVTGGSLGIGFETARVLKDAGARVCIIARSKERLEEAANELGVESLVCDVSDEAQVEQAVPEVISRLGGLDVLINNAAYGYFAPLADIETEKFEEMLSVNLTGAMLVARACARHFISRSGGNIVNISSTAGLKGFPGGSAYVASKFALKGMTECWRAELREHNIRVMLVNPSEVQTSFVVNSGREKRPYNPSKLQAEDIAHTIKSMLCMHDRGFIPEATVWATNPK